MGFLLRFVFVRSASFNSAAVRPRWLGRCGPRAYQDQFRGFPSLTECMLGLPVRVCFLHKKMICGKRQSVGYC